MGKNRPPLGKSLPPPAQNTARPARGAKAAAKSAFKAAHLAHFGTPSGTATWKITLSKHSKRWFYQAEETSGNGFAITPGKLLAQLAMGEPYRKTNLTVTACIGWKWAPEAEVASWQEALATHARLTNDHMIALGAEPVTPPHPAEAAWLVHCLRKIKEPAVTRTSSYTARVHLHTALALGPHLILTPAPGPAAGRALIEHIRQHAIRRLRGFELPF